MADLGLYCDYTTTVIDDYSRFILTWELKGDMAADIAYRFRPGRQWTLLALLMCRWTTGRHKTYSSLALSSSDQWEDREVVCPLYDCGVNRKQLDHCGLRDEFPCTTFNKLRNPSLSEEALRSRRCELYGERKSGPETGSGNKRFTGGKWIGDGVG